MFSQLSYISPGSRQVTKPCSRILMILEYRMCIPFKADFKHQEIP